MVESLHRAILFSEKFSTHIFPFESHYFTLQVRIVKLTSDLLYITICEIDDLSKFNACNRALTQSRCTGKTLRDGMGKEVGGGFRMGDPRDSCQCMAKITTML